MKYFRVIETGDVFETGSNRFEVNTERHLMNTVTRMPEAVGGDVVECAGRYCT